MICICPKFRLSFFLLSSFLSSFFLTTLGLTQDTSRVVVTRIEQVVRVSPLVLSVMDEESFPDYLTQMPALTEQVYAQLKPLLEHRFPGKSVGFSLPTTPWLRYQNLVEPLKPSASTGAGTYAVAIQQVVQLVTTGADTVGMPVRNFLSTCQVLVQDSRGKVVFTHTVQQPFRTVSRAGNMSGKGEITATDWVDLLIRSVKGALDEKGPKRLSVQSFYRPPLTMDSYGFLPGQTLFYTWQETETGSNFKGASREKKISFGLMGTTPVRWKSQQSFSLNETYIRGEYRTRLLVQNTQSGSEYDITAVGSVVRDSANYFSKVVSPVQVRCTAQRLLVGDYTLNHNSMEGQVGYDIYNLRMVLPRNTFELRINDNLRAIIQKGGKYAGKQAIYLSIHKEATSAEIDKILLSFLIFQMGNDLGVDFLGY